jgi:hypothetical protein
MLRTTRRLTVAAILVSSLAGTAGCGGPEAPPPKRGGADTVNQGERAKITQSRKLIDNANDAINTKDYTEAREMLAKATKLGVASHGFEIGEVSEKLDKREAKLWANEVSDTLGSKKSCAKAFKELAEPIVELESEAFTRELRKLVGAQALKCAQGVVDAAATAGRFAEARSFINDDATKAILSAAAVKKLAGELEAAINDALVAQLDEDLQGKRWTQALEKLDAMVRKKEANPEQAAVLLAKIREGAAPGIAARARGAIGQRNASETLTELDALIKSLRWEVMTQDAAALAKDSAMPQEIATLREALAVWVETQRLAMKPLKKPEKRWTHGKIAILPASKADGSSKRDLNPSTEVWILGQTKEQALVTDADPSKWPLVAQLGKAMGWVPVARLAKNATFDWLPPDDQLKGERVWAPLRAPDPVLELGTVAEIKGNDIVVKRMADDALVKVARTAVRSGRLAPGTKVLTHCTAKDQVATIEELMVAGRGVPAVRLKCDGGVNKEELLPSLRTKSEFLPAAR